MVNVGRVRTSSGEAGNTSGQKTSIVALDTYE